MVYAVFVAKITPCGYDHDMRCLGQVEKELSDSTGDTPDRQEQMQNGSLGACKNRSLECFRSEKDAER